MFERMNLLSQPGLTKPQDVQKNFPPMVGMVADAWKNYKTTFRLILASK